MQKCHSSLPEYKKQTNKTKKIFAGVKIMIPKFQRTQQKEMLSQKNLNCLITEMYQCVMNQTESREEVEETVQRKER